MKTRLRRLQIENIGLIETAEVALDNGLTVFTGETGSGKTMLINALGLGMGGRMASDVLKRASARGRVTLELEVDAETAARLDAAGFGLDPGENAVVSREITASGKSAVRVNGRLANGTQLRELLEPLIARVGQHDQQRLLDGSEHLAMLDRFAGEGAWALRNTVAQTAVLLADLDQRLGRMAHTARQADDLQEEAQSELDRIDRLDVQDGEDVKLRERRDRLQHAERIANAVRVTHALLTDDDDSVTARLGEALGHLRAVAQYEPQIEDLLTRLTALQSECTDTALSLARVSDEDIAGPNESEAIADRLERVERLKRRHGGSIDGIRTAQRRFRAVLDGTASNARERAELDARRRAVAVELAEHAARLTDLRRSSAALLERAVETELRELAMANARFRVVFAPLEAIGPSGAERVDFYLAANAGETPKPLAKVASGGELSRVLLAIVAVVAADAGTAAFIFDEIDAGIGGATATAVGERLRRLARSAQVICVTHLAQIAAVGTVHYRLDKRQSEDETEIRITRLETAAARTTEIARMLSGDTGTIARKHAAALLAQH